MSANYKEIQHKYQAILKKYDKNDFSIELCIELLKMIDKANHHYVTATPTYGNVHVHAKYLGAYLHHDFLNRKIKLFDLYIADVTGQIKTVYLKYGNAEKDCLYKQVDIYKQPLDYLNGTYGHLIVIAIRRYKKSPNICVI